MLTSHKLEHILDLNCGAGDLLIYLATRLRQIVGVGIGADGFLVRRGNQAITAGDLEKRLIQVPANPVDVCVDTKRVFDRIGITTQLWGELDCILATNLFAEPGAARCRSLARQRHSNPFGDGQKFPQGPSAPH